MSRQILLADDSNTIAKMVQITFAHEDYTVTAVKSGDDAIQRARGARPDIILVDAGLNGKSGYDVCGDLRAAGLKDVPVLILTNNFVPYDEARGQRAGADGFVVKPFETQALIDRVNQTIAQRASGGRPAAVAQPSSSSATTVSGRPTPMGTPAIVTTPAASQSGPRPIVQRAEPPAATPAPMASRPISQPHAAAPPANAPSAHSPSAPMPVAAPPRANVPESGTNLPRPRATLMGLPTVGPDGLPVTLAPPTPAPRVTAPQPVSPPPAAAAPAAHAPAPAAHAPQPAHAAPVAARPATVAAPTAPTMAMPAPVLPRHEAPPARHQASDFATVQATLPGPHAQRMTPPSLDALSSSAQSMGSSSAMSALSGGAAQPRRAAIPATAPRMPRPSLVPNAPSPEALRGLVQAVAAAAAPRISQAFGAHPEYEAIARLSREVIEQIAWEVVPELAEIILRQELDRLVKERTRS